MKAWIENDTVRDVVEDPSVFTADIAALYNTDVPPGTVNGARLVDGVWVNPAPTQAPEPAPEPVAAPEPVKVSPIEFKLLFTAQERVAIKAARQTDPIIDDFYDIVEDPRLTHVNLSLQSTQDAVGYLAVQGLIDPERVAHILAGEVQ